MSKVTTREADMKRTHIPPLPIDSATTSCTTPLFTCTDGRLVTDFPDGYREW